MSELADLLERFRRGAELVAVATTGAAGPVLDFRPAEGKWGVRTIVCHLADTEIVLAMRLRQVIAEDNPVMPAIDQDAWADRLDYSKRKLSPALETFRRTRAENYELLKICPKKSSRAPASTASAEPSRCWICSAYSPSIAEKHVQQIHAARAAFKEFKAAQARSLRPTPA